MPKQLETQKESENKKLERQGEARMRAEALRCDGRKCLKMQEKTEKTQRKEVTEGTKRQRKRRNRGAEE